MATLTLTRNPQKFTLSGTSEHTINVNKFVPAYSPAFEALIRLTSGTLVQLSADGEAIDEDSAELSSANKETIVDVSNGVALRVKGGAGSEVIMVNIISKQ